MIVGACRLTFHLPASQSLKDKRQVVRSVVARVRNRYNAAIAEIEEQNTWRTAVIGIVCVSNNGGHVDSMLQDVVDYIESSRLDVEIVDQSIEIVPVL